jgi:thiosulfate/3-mercaptopyruvate sulfurtransferase
MTSPLVSAEQLAGHLGDPNWAIFDCRFDLSDVSAGMASYLAGHIPGAHYADLDRHLAGQKTGRNGRHPLPDRAQLASFFREHGVGLDTMVVAYDARDGMYAARLWWLLRWLGHAHVAVLDGGLSAWTAAQLPTDQAVVTVLEHGDLVAQTPLVETVEIDAVANKEQHGLVVLDARGGPRYRGEVEPLDRVAGHIPGALNRPYTDNLDANGHFLSAQTLKAAFSALVGEHPSSKIVSQCGSGVTACHNLLAMEIAGLSNGILYPGSWSEWSSDPARPVAIGPHP